MKRKDIEQIIHNAYKYNDQEVINHLSKNQRIAGVLDDFRNMMSGGGFQTKQMPSGYQFATSADFTSFMSGTGASVNTVAVESIINFWRDALNAKKIDYIEIPAVKDEVVGTGASATTNKVDYIYKLRPRNYVYYTDWLSIWSSLRPTDYNQAYGLNLTTSPFPITTYNLRPANFPQAFVNINQASSGIEFKSGPLFVLGGSASAAVKIESGGSGSNGYIEALKLHLAAHPPMDNDDNHALLIKEIGTAMSAATTGFWGRAGAGDDYFTSMLRQNSIGQDKVQGLASTWNYVVGLPELIQKRQGKAPGGVLEYKQKLILKSKGIELQKLLDKKFEYTDTTGQKQFVRIADFNKLSKDNFTTVLGLARADLARVGDCVAFIQQELDKDNSPIRKFIKDTDAYSAVFRGKPNIKL